MGRRVTSGVLPYQDIIELGKKGHINLPDKSWLEQDAQTSSLNIRLSECIARNQRMSVAPHVGIPVEQALEPYTNHTFHLKESGFLSTPSPEGGGIYVVRGAIDLDLPSDTGAIASGRSGSARDLVKVTTLIDGVPDRDIIPPGYKGPVYVEIVSNSFTGNIARHLSLSQLRFYRGKLEDCFLTDEQIKARHRKRPIVYDEQGNALDLKKPLLNNGINFRADTETSPVYLAKRGAPPLDFRTGGHDARKYFYQRTGDVQLFRFGWAVVPSREQFSMPMDLAAEIMEMDSAKGNIIANISRLLNAGHGYQKPLRVVGECTALTPTILPHNSPFSKYFLCSLLGASEKTYETSLPKTLSGRFDPNSYPWKE